MSERRFVFRVVGETLREIGVLAAVFVPLESAVSERSIDVSVLTGLSVASFAMILCGILLEVKNR